MPSSVSCIQTSILLHSKHAYSAPQRCWRGKGSFRHKKPGNKTRISPPPLHFAACWWPSTQASLGPRSRPQTPGILLSLPLLSRFDPHFQGKRQFEKKNGFEWNKTPSPPNPRHYGAVTLGGERALWGSNFWWRGGWPPRNVGAARRYIRYTRRSRVLACSRPTTSHFELAYDGVARPARPHIRTCICSSWSRRGCAVSAFVAFGLCGAHTRPGVRNRPFLRGFSGLPIFYYFLKRFF